MERAVRGPCCRCLRQRGCRTRRVIELYTHRLQIQTIISAVSAFRWGWEWVWVNCRRCRCNIWQALPSAVPPECMFLPRDSKSETTVMWPGLYRRAHQRFLRQRDSQALHSPKVRAYLVLHSAAWPLHEVIDAACTLLARLDFDYLAFTRRPTWRGRCHWLSLALEPFIRRKQQTDAIGTLRIVWAVNYTDRNSKFVRPIPFGSRVHHCEDQLVLCVE